MNVLNKINITIKQTEKVLLKDIYKKMGKFSYLIYLFRFVKFETVNLYPNNKLQKHFLISLKGIKGINIRDDRKYKNWFSFFEKQSYHNLVLESSENVTLLNNFLDESCIPNNSGDIPQVYLHNDKLYINEGLHRLSLAKGLFKRKFYVTVFYDNEEQIKRAKKKGVIF